MTKGVKAFGYLKLIPSAFFTLINIHRVQIYAKIKKRRSMNYFREGLEEAGMDGASSKKIIKECFNGEDDKDRKKG